MNRLDSQCLKSTFVNVSIINGLTRLSIVQRYKIEGDSALEVYYKFPVPANYIVTGFKINIGDKTINCILKEKYEAINEYNKAIPEGNSGFLLQSCNNEHLECCLGNVTPGTNIKVTITLCCELRREPNSQTYRLIIPTKFANKYSPHDIGGVLPLSAIHGGVQYSMKIHLNIKMIGGINIIICNNTIAFPNSENYQFDIEPDNLDRDIIVVIDCNVASSYVISNNNTELTHSKFKYATQLNIIPEPVSLSVIPASDIHYCLILDKSRSMFNDMNVLKEAVKTAVNILPSGCIADIYAFSTNFERFTCEFEITCSEYKIKALKWIDNINCGGSTEVIPVLEDAYRQIEKSGKMGSIIFLSDGEVTNINEIVNLIRDHPTVRVFTIGISYRVSKELIRDMAEAGMGTSEFAGYKATLESNVASTVLRAQTSLSCENKYTLDIKSKGSYEIVPRTLPPLVGNYNNVFYIFSESPIDLVIFNGNPIIVDSYNGDYNAINSIAALKYMKTVSGIPHLKGTYSENEYKVNIIECSIANNVLSEFTSYIGVEQRNDKSTGNSYFVKIPLQAPARSNNPVHSSNLAHFSNSSYFTGGLNNLFVHSERMMGCCRNSCSNISPPSEAEISAIINRVFNNEPTKTAIQNMLSSLQGCQDFGSGVQESTTPVTLIDPTKLNYIKSGPLAGEGCALFGNLLISVNNVNLSLLCEGPKLQLSCGDIVELINVGKFKVILVGSDTEKWILKEITTTL